MRSWSCPGLGENLRRQRGAGLSRSAAAASLPNELHQVGLLQRRAPDRRDGAAVKKLGGVIVLSSLQMQPPGEGWLIGSWVKSGTPGGLGGVYFS